MHDRARSLLGENAGQQRPILDIALIQGHPIGNGKAETGGQIVDHRHRPSGVFQGENGVAANIAGATSYEHGRFVDHDPPDTTALRQRG